MCYWYCRYKNAAPLGPSALRKSADVLREELEKDALIRNLRERVAEAEAGAGVREKELQAAIERLRADNRQLTVELHRMSSSVFASEASAVAAVEEDRRRCREELEACRAKLLWYAENQELIDKGNDNCLLLYLHSQVSLTKYGLLYYTGESERQDLLADLKVCKRELRLVGVDLKTLNLASSKPGAGKTSSADVPDESVMVEGGDVAGGQRLGKASKGGKAAVGGDKSPSKVLKISRSPADIKRIK